MLGLVYFEGQGNESPHFCVPESLEPNLSPSRESIWRVRRPNQHSSTAQWEPHAEAKKEIIAAAKNSALLATSLFHPSPQLPFYPLFYILAGLHKDRVHFAVQLRTLVTASVTESSEGGGGVGGGGDNSTDQSA